ncbi:MAG: hypothetical protein QOF33_4288, partial [Thermomicrobiales bacterium]|nr:hypothetical protein [Thermomicrobiales bacterium]
MRAATRPTTLTRLFVRRVARLGGLFAAVAALIAIMPASAIAQTPTAAASTGITVIGYGEASAPAESGTLQLLLTRGEFYGGPPAPPRPGDVPGAEERRLAAPIVQAVVAKGIAESAVTVVVLPILGSAAYGPGGPAVARIDVALERPDLTTVTELISAASVAATEEALVLGQVGAAYEVADCAALDRSARQAAIEDARARAEVQADLLGVTLGDGGDARQDGADGGAQPARRDSWQAAAAHRESRGAPTIASSFELR